MNPSGSRRRVLRRLAGLSALPAFLHLPRDVQAAEAAATAATGPGDAPWQELAAAVRELIRVRSPLSECMRGGNCDTLFAAVKNPYFTGDDVALTQTLGWVDAWTTQASPYAVAAYDWRDVAAAASSRSARGRPASGL